MASDTFICGTCHAVYHDINLFMQHKADVACVMTSGSPSSTSVLHLTSDNATHSNTTYFIVQDEAELASATVMYPVSQSGSGGSTILKAVVVPDGSVPKQGISLGEVVPFTCNEGVLEIVPVAESSMENSSTSHGLDLQLFVRPGHSASHPSQNDGLNSRTAPKTGRKRGRPRKSEDKHSKVPAPERTEFHEPVLPEKEADGKYRCVRCQKSFARDRHFKTHRCLAMIGYVDITWKEAFDNGDEEAGEEKEDDLDGSTSIRSRVNKVMVEIRKKGNQPSSNKISPKKTKLSEESASTNDDASTPSQIELAPTNDLSGDISMSRSLHDDIGTRGQNMPVFRDENERLAFDQSVQVDLGPLVDHLFKQHSIDQNVNENAPPTRARMQSTLNVYSCDMCRKVFMSLSHVRLHCLIHTDLKPFKCFKCSYATNTRGNLYTHMRTHTGMVFRCATCDFTAINRGHLVEHEQTHSDVRHRCNICNRDYNTTKSLVNHIRKYHRTSEGAAYLSQFQKKCVKNPALLHQCQICNRRFKKRVELERHLVSHEIFTPASKVLACEVCDYVSSRRAYLENHMRRHRVVYVCAFCSKKFPSSLHLQAHLKEAHWKDEVIDDSSAEGLFQQCLEVSLFLPESDGSMVGWVLSNSNNGEELDNDLEKSVSDNGTLPKVPEIDTVSFNQHASTDQSQGVSMDIAVNDSRVSHSNNFMKIPEFSCLDAVLPSDQQPDYRDCGTLKPENCPDQSESSKTFAVEMKFDEQRMEECSNGLKEQMEEGKSPTTVCHDSKTLSHNEQDIFEKLGYILMNQMIFENIQNMFGKEECEFCGRLFISKPELRNHLHVHTGEKPFGCDQCSYRTLTKESLHCHIKNLHSGAVFICHLCKWHGRSHAALQLHNQKRHRSPPEYLCTKCNATFNSVKRLRIHLEITHTELSRVQVRELILSFRRQHNRLGRRIHKCPYCEKAFPSSALNLQKHIWIHEGVKPYKCALCPYSCRSRSNLSAHMVRHSSEKPFRCTHCDKPYKSRTALRWHIRSHKDGQVFACDRCPYKAIQPSHLKRHLETHDVVKRFPCKLCSYSANTESYLKIHCTRNHEGQAIPGGDLMAAEESSSTNNDNQQAFQCISCEFRFGNISDMKRHLKMKHQMELVSIKDLEKSVTGVEELGTDIEGRMQFYLLIFR